VKYIRLLKVKLFYNPGFVLKWNGGVWNLLLWVIPGWCSEFEIEIVSQPQSVVVSTLQECEWKSNNKTKTTNDEFDTSGWEKVEENGGENAKMCVCACVCVHVCVCVSDRGIEIMSKCVCVWVCVREREREWKGKLTFPINQQADQSFFEPWLK